MVEVPDVEVHGDVAPGFEPVRDAFVANLVERGEVGASMAVTVAGEAVVDLWGGLADRETGRPWERDTLVNFYSVGKALGAVLVLRLVDAGTLRLEDPVAAVWPEFAAGGKETVTIRHAITHTAGVPAIAPPLADDDLWSWETMTAALATTPAVYPPGSRIWYHANTYGHLVGEILRRATGRMPGVLLADLASSIGADVHVGLSAADQARCATVVLPDRSSLVAPIPGGGTANPGSAVTPGATSVGSPADERAIVHRGYFNPTTYSSFGVVNTSRWRHAQVLSTNGHGTAAGLAAFYQALLQPDRVVSHDLLTQATQVQVGGPCPALGEPVGFGLGFLPTSARRPLGPNPGAYGHFGTGGALGFADPVGRVAFGYVMNRVDLRWQSARNRALIDALYACL